MVDKDIFDTIVECFVNEKLDDIMMRDSEYIKLQEEIWQEKDGLDKLNLSDTQRIKVENLIALHIKAIELYSKIAYRQGYIDCVSLLKEVGVIKDA